MNLIAHTTPPPPRMNPGSRTGISGAVRQAIRALLDGEATFFTFEKPGSDAEVNRIRSIWSTSAKAMGTRVSVYSVSPDTLAVRIAEQA